MKINSKTAFKTLLSTIITLQILGTYLNIKEDLKEKSDKKVRSALVAKIEETPQGRLNNKLWQTYQQQKSGYERNEKLMEWSPGYTPDTEANKFLNKFPESITNAKSIKKYPVQGARHCIIHIRQKHFVYTTKENDGTYSGGLTEEELEQINKVQEDISKIATYLADSCNIKEAYKEGITRNVQVQEHIMKETNIIIEDIINHNPNININENTDWTELFEKYKYVPGGINEPAFEGKITLLPSELQVVQDCGLEASNIEKKELYEEFVRQRREFAALQVLAQDTSTAKLIVYGGSHRYADNIIVWNKMFPDKKYSLIEILPENY